MKPLTGLAGVTDYAFTTERLPDGDVRLSWSENGSNDPLSFWIVAACDVEEAKRIIRSGEIGAVNRETMRATYERDQALLDKYLGTN